MSNNFCTNIVDCIISTDKALDMTKSSKQSLTAKERQFLLLLRNDDAISRKFCYKLVDKIPVKQMVMDGLLQQSKECRNFQNLLENHTQVLMKKSSKLANFIEKDIKENTTDSLPDKTSKADDTEQNRQSVKESTNWTNKTDSKSSRRKEKRQQSEPEAFLQIAANLFD